MLSSLVKHDEPKTSQVLITCPNNAKRQLDCEYSIYIYLKYVCLYFIYVSHMPLCSMPLRCAAHGLIHPLYARKHVGATEV